MRRGTNRSQFFRGETDKYTWQSVGSSYLPGELIAAFLWAQLEQAEQISQLRLRLWNHYFELTKQLEEAGLLRRPRVPESCQHNAHIYYVLLQQGIDRSMILEQMKAKGCMPSFTMFRFILHLLGKYLDVFRENLRTRINLRNG